MSFVTLLGCGGGSGPTAVSPASTSVEVEYESYSLVNAARAEHEVEPQLDLGARVAEVARRHSEEMRDQGFFGHVGPSGTELSDRLRSAGISFTRAGENLARVTTTVNPAATAHADLMLSESHRRNILSPGYSVVGVGVARSGNTYWVTQVYLEP